ncbi:MAG: hypothetical protein IIX47_03280 [Spirochaetaceae bacterium]|nr:hypothetical protein [Spirochaetaceae bacterium]
MENIPISLSYLETLSTADLLELAEEYDLDIPEQLNRRFIISEILEIADTEDMKVFIRKAIDQLGDMTYREFYQEQRCLEMLK